ncbi:hypothetical protein D5086_011161 [Populus alba]|uniref:Uncharacterized protein n=1 Tax=Populus alba TaxID=43335 RepID=A0ACC4CCK8_POPAL
MFGFLAFLMAVFSFGGASHISSRFKFACRGCTGLGVGLQEVVGFHLALCTVERCEILLLPIWCVVLTKSMLLSEGPNMPWNMINWPPVDDNHDLGISRLWRVGSMHDILACCNYDVDLLILIAYSTAKCRRLLKLFTFRLPCKRVKYINPTPIPVMKLLLQSAGQLFHFQSSKHNDLLKPQTSIYMDLKYGKCTSNDIGAGFSYSLSFFQVLQEPAQEHLIKRGYGSSHQLYSLYLS